MNPIIPLFCIFVLLGGCVNTSTDLDRTTPIRFAKQAISQREQWAYDGDYKVTPIRVNGKPSGWKVSVMRINDPKLPAGNKARYDGATPVIITLDESGRVVSYSSPYQKQ